VEQDPTQDRLLLELQKRTNTELEFVTAPWDSESTRVTTILSSGEQMDVMAIDTNAYDYASFARNGLLLPLDDYLATGKWPTLAKLAYGDIYNWRYNVDGKVYGIPMPIQPGDWNNYIRSDWLEKLGLSMPTTPDEMYEVLKAFKEKDPDGNGVNDTLGVYVAQRNGQLQPLYAMFMNIYGSSFDVSADGKLQFLYTSPQYKEALTYVNKLYREGLINQDLFTINDKNYVRYQFSAGVSGWVTSPMIAGDFNELLKVQPGAKIDLMSPLPHTANSIGAYAGDASWNARAASRRLEVDDPGCLIELRCGGQPTNRSQITAVAALYLTSRGCALQQTPATPSTGRCNASANQRPTIASTSAFRNRSTTSMNPIDGTSSRSAVMEAIW
jgi:ABC-type glycerol-3-phosphate transport system substrate-binding protein